MVPTGFAGIAKLERTRIRHHTDKGAPRRRATLPQRRHNVSYPVGRLFVEGDAGVETVDRDFGADLRQCQGVAAFERLEVPRLVVFAP